ncbi:MAG TPA: ABC transporter ATP-binding protein [Beijerinckiaceae bacterium]|nr:ABC transporter ATP-binding protein [Beijerinckiaceae bacterium]
MASVTFKDVSKRFAATPAVDHLNLAIADGEFVALLGPSGCGKTTLLRLVAGFEAPEDGKLMLGEAIVGRRGWTLPPERRRVGMVFQSYALWPHMSVGRNVAFALDVRRVPRVERDKRVAEALAMVGLEAHRDRRPSELSGGQKQRVALARCLAMQPDVILLDEPLANLDAHLRGALQQEFARLHRQLGATFIYVTHDQSEAMALADRVAVMNAGRLEQVAPPRMLYREPATEMVARFVGGGMIVPAHIVGGDATGTMVDVGGIRVKVRGTGRAGETRFICLHPEDLALTPDVNASALKARVQAAAFQGAATMLTLAAEEIAGAPELRVETMLQPPEIGALVGVEIRGGWLLPAAANPFPVGEGRSEGPE